MGGGRGVQWGAAGWLSKGDLDLSCLLGAVEVRYEASCGLLLIVY